MNALTQEYQAGNTSGITGQVDREQTVYVVDDDPAVCHALKLFLEGEDYSVRVFTSAEALLEDVNYAAPEGVLVLDQRMGGMSGLELQVELGTLCIEWPIIFMSGHGDIATSVRAMKTGAIDFLEKPFGNKDLLESIKNAFQLVEATEEVRICMAATERRCIQLTPREREVMQYVVSGTNNKDIAQRLGISNRTIDVHRSRVMEKMGADTLPDLVQMTGICRLCARGLHK